MSRPLFACLIGYVGSRAIFAAMKFRYELCVEPFNAGKLAIDFGVWVVCFGVAYWMLGLRKR